MPRKPGAKAIVAYRGKLLLILRDNKPTIPFPNTWNAPGGGVEEGESPEEAVCRELLEEISIVPAHREPAEVVTYDDGSIVYRFFCILSHEEYAKVKLGDEGQRINWFTYEEVLALDLSPHLRMYVEKQKENIKKLLERSCTDL